MAVPEKELKKVLQYNKCKYDLGKKDTYKKYQKAVGDILLEEAKWFELNKQIKKDEKFAMPLPVKEVKEAIAKNLDKISKNSIKLEQAEKILK